MRVAMTFVDRQLSPLPFQGLILCLHLLLMLIANSTMAFEKNIKSSLTHLRISNRYLGITHLPRHAPAVNFPFLFKNCKFTRFDTHSREFYLPYIEIRKKYIEKTLHYFFNIYIYIYKQKLKTEDNFIARLVVSRLGGDLQVPALLVVQ